MADSWINAPSAVVVRSFEWRAEAPATVSSGEMQLWWIDLAASAEAEAAEWEILDGEERRRALLFVGAEHRRRFIMRRGARRRILAEVLGVSAAAIRFEQSARGRPFLAEALNAAPPGICFSTSHSGSVGVVALARGVSIGVDIEVPRPLDDIESIAAIYFAADERDAILASAGSDRLTAFYKCWTGKEAYLKATGEGLARALDSFSVGAGAPSPSGTDTGPAGAVVSVRLGWELHDISRLPGVIGTLAVERV